MKEKLTSQLSKSNFQNWMGVEGTSNSYMQCSHFSASAFEENADTKQLVYLTSDAEETLYNFDPSCAYIIGGIVDRNKLKGMTYDKAQRQGVRTAKLPLKEYMDFSATPVLTVNHVFEIMLSVHASKDWAGTLARILPQRKEAHTITDEHAKMSYDVEQTDDSKHECDEHSGNEPRRGRPPREPVRAGGAWAHVMTMGENGERKCERRWIPFCDDEENTHSKNNGATESLPQQSLSSSSSSSSSAPVQPSPPPVQPSPPPVQPSSSPVLPSSLPVPVKMLQHESKESDYEPAAKRQKLRDTSICDTSNDEKNQKSWFKSSCIIN
jgi:hypothetical protein